MSFSDFARDYVAKGKVMKIDVRNHIAVAYLKDEFSQESLNNAEKNHRNIEDIENKPPSEEVQAGFFVDDSQIHDIIKKEEQKAQTHSFNIDKNLIVYFEIENFETLFKKMQILQDELGIPRIEHIDIITTQTEMNQNGSKLFNSVLFLIIMATLSYKAFKFQGNIRNISNGIFSDFSTKFTKMKNGEKPVKSKTKLKDVAGLKNAKLEIKEFVDFLKSKETYTKLGAKIPKGALLIGPPGVGKTLLAKAIAGETDCPFYSVSGSDFLEMFVGVGASRVRNLFRKARMTAPSIIFIDEIDSVAKKRHSSLTRNNSERESTLNQLLVEMDGFQHSAGVVVFAGTNQPDSLDPALLRPGRFDRRIAIDLPDIKEREEIFMVHLKPLKLKPSAELIAKKMAAFTPRFSGADIANICNEAAIFAGRSNKKLVEMEDFAKAIDRVIAGVEKSKSPISPLEREHIAYHEAGHAVAGWFTKHADPLLKVTIIPRTGGIMGFAQYLPHEIAHMTVDQIRDAITMALGGRAAELIFFGHLSTGAANDLEKVTQLAYGFVRIFGFSDKVGHLSFPGSENPFKSPYSNKLGNTIDAEVQKLVADTFEKTKALIIEQKAKVEALAKELLLRETLTHDEVIEILGPKPYQSDQYKKYLEKHKVADAEDPSISNGVSLIGGEAKIAFN